MAKSKHRSKARKRPARPHRPMFEAMENVTLMSAGPAGFLKVTAAHVQPHVAVRAAPQTGPGSIVPGATCDSNISFELANAPCAPTAKERVTLWLKQNKDRIVDAEKRFRVDRRAIAGAIAWEALVNVKSSITAPRAAGPGKVHFREYYYVLEGNPIAKQVENGNYSPSIPKKTMSERKALLETPSGAITYIAAIMNAYATEAAKAKYNIRNDAPILTTYFNGVEYGKDFKTFREFLVKKYPGKLVPNPDMGTWVKNNINYLQNAVGSPNQTFA